MPYAWRLEPWPCWRFNAPVRPSIPQDNETLSKPRPRQKGMNMYRNEHADLLSVQTEKAESIKQAIHQLQSESTWYREFDCDVASADLAQLARKIAETQQRLDLLTSSSESLRREKTKLDEAAGSGSWLASLWLSAEQKVAKYQAAELGKRLELLTQSRREVEAELNKHKPGEASLTQSLQRYRQFDLLEASATEAGMAQELLQLQSLMESTRLASNKWEAMAGAAVREWAKSARQLELIENDIAEAEGMERALSSTHNRHEKWSIHQACLGRFDVQNPSLVVKRLKGKRAYQEQELAKKKDRVEDNLRLLENAIETLILDGNNLCYRPAENGRSTFIGLGVVSALVPHLSELYKVVVLFDPGICGRLATTEANLQAQFPQARVSVMGNGAKADEGILAAAAFDAGAFIISNDRFADYSEQAAVKERRVLTHIIHAQSVQIQQLQVNIPYN